MKHVRRSLAITVCALASACAAGFQPAQNDKVPPPPETVSVVRQLIAVAHERVNPFELTNDGEIRVAWRGAAFIKPELGNPYYEFEYYPDGSLKTLIHRGGSRADALRKLEWKGQDLPHETEWLTEQEVGAIVRRANLLLQDAGYIIDFTIPTSGDLVDKAGQPIKVVSVRQEPHYDGLPFMGLRPFNHKVMYAQADAISINRQTGELGLYVSQHPDAKIIPANKVAQLRDLDSIALNGVDYLPPGVQARVNFRGLAWASLGDHNWRRSVTVGRSGYSHHGYLGTWMSDHWRNVRQETPGAYRLYYVLKLTWGDTEPGRRMPNDPTGTSGLYTFYLDPANGELVCAEFDHVNDLLFRSGSGAEAPAPNLLAWAPAGDERAEAWGGLTAAKAPATYSKGVPVTMIATDDSILTFQWHEASGLVSQNGRYYKPEKPLAAALQAYESPKVKAPQWHKLAEASAPNN